MPPLPSRGGTIHTLFQPSRTSRVSFSFYLNLIFIFRQTTFFALTILPLHSSCNVKFDCSFSKFYFHFPKISFIVFIIIIMTFLVIPKNISSQILFSLSFTAVPHFSSYRTPLKTSLPRSASLFPKGGVNSEVKSSGKYP